MEVFSFLFGAIFGSFLNVLILRLPKKESVVFPRSYCPKCKHTISWYYNIPLLSYIFLKGKCAYCKEKISIQYFIVEFICAIITLFLYLKIGLSIQLIYAIVFFYTLIVLSFIDLRYKAVPDYLLLLALFFSFFVSNFSLLETFKNSFIIAGAFVLLNFIVTFYIQNIKAKLLKDKSLETQEAMGEGDIPILAVIGAVLGLKGALVAIFLASIFAIIPSIYNNIKNKEIQTPFIPYLVLGLVVEFFINLSKVFN